jgi:tetratricopeptide (TPR) repeat protein
VQKLKQGNFRGAIEDFNSVVQLNPRYYEGYCLRGLAEFHSGNLKAALSDFNSTLQLNPRHADAYRGRGTAYAQLGDFQKAIARITPGGLTSAKTLPLCFQHRAIRLRRIGA